MSRLEFLEAVDRCNLAMVWFNLGSSESQAYHMTLVRVAKEDLLRLFEKMPHVTRVRALMIENDVLCVG